VVKLSTHAVYRFLGQKHRGHLTISHQIFTWCSGVITAMRE